MSAVVPGTHEPGFVEPYITQQKIPDELSVWASLPQVRSPKVYRMGELSIMVARESAGVDDEPLWHLSISHPDRHPTWDEIKVARYRLLPDELCFGMLLPPAQFYVNVRSQDHVFHLWEITDPREAWSGG